MPREKANNSEGVSGAQERQSLLRRLGKDTRTRFALALTGAILLHEPAYHEPIERGWNAATTALSDWYEEWQEERAQRAIVAQTPPEAVEQYKQDIKTVKEMNAERKKRIEERKEDAARFKQEILAHPDQIEMDRIFFPLEYYSQGVEEDEMRVAREVFRIKNEDIEVPVIGVPNPETFRQMVGTFMPPGSHHRLKTSAVHTLAQNLGPESQNCVARARLMVMSVATKYPELARSLYFQQFGDHTRTLVEVDGVRHILEGDVATFPDKLTDTKRNEVMPLDVWLQIYAGADRKQFSDRIEFYGPEKKSDERNYARVTDNLVGEFKSPDLDNIGDAESWYRPANGVPGQPGEEGDMSVAQSGPEALGQGSGSLLNGSGQTPGLSEYREPTPTWLTIEDLDIDTGGLDYLFGGDLLPTHAQLNFTNLKKLDGEAAKTIVKFIGDVKKRREAERQENASVVRRQWVTPIQELDFPVVSEITAEGAEEIAKVNAGLRFEALNSLEEGVARGLSKHQRRKVFRNLKLLPAESARALVAEKPKENDLLLAPKLPEIDASDLIWVTIEDPVLNEDDEPEGCSGEGSMGGASGRSRPLSTNEMYRPLLSIQGLVGFSAEAGKELGLYNGDLEFEDCEIGTAAAEGLAQLKRSISASGMKPDFYRGLSKHQHQLRVTEERIELELARILARHEGLLSINVHTAYAEGALETLFAAPAELQLSGPMVFGAHELEPVTTRKGKLTLLNRLASDDETAKVLSQHEGELNLPTVTSIAASQAQYLAQHRGPLRFINLEELSLEAALPFTRFQDDLQFNGRQFSKDVIRILGRKPGKLYISSFEFISPEGNRQLGVSFEDGRTNSALFR